MKSEFIDNRYVIKLEGRLIMSNSDEIKNAIKKELTSNKFPVRIDLKNVEFLDSTGIGVLISIFKFLKERNLDMTVANPNDTVKWVMTITKLDTILTVENLANLP